MRDKSVLSDRELHRKITDIIETREFQLEQENNFTNTPVHNN